MMHFYGTFGQGQYDGLLRDYYVEITAPHAGEAMKLMRLAFSNNYANVRDGLPDEDLIKLYPKGCLGRLEFKE